MGDRVDRKVNPATALSVRWWGQNGEIVWSRLTSDRLYGALIVYRITKQKPLLLLQHGSTWHYINPFIEKNK